MNYYAKAIEVITDPAINFQELVIAITKAHPKVVVDASQNTRPQRELQVLPIIRAGRKIEAIKKWRELTGSGLGEAKEAIDEIARKHGL